MARYIDADRFLERLKASPAFPNMGMDGYFLLDVVEELLKKFPTADVVPKSEGEWEITKGSHGKEIMICTNCRHSQDLHSTFTYCPNCGAKMKGGAEE